MSEEKDGVLDVGTKAVISWLDADGKEVGAESCPRSMPSILAHLETQASHDPDDNVKICLRIAEPGKDGKPQTAEIELTKGKLADVIEDVRSRVLSPEQALMQFHLAVSKLMDLSCLKGAMITGVFDDGEATGFTVLSESTPVTEVDIKVLGTAAAAQVDDFKHKMRTGKLEITFPDDEEGIVMPAGVDPKAEV